jgi:hypothetical protein
MEPKLQPKLTPAEDEVAAHSMSTGMAQPKLQPKMEPKLQPKLTPADDEVAAHSMSTGMAQPKLQPKMEPKLQPKLQPAVEDEVEAHMRFFGISLDPDGKYKINIE